MRQQLTLITINIERGKKKKNIKERVAKINVASLFLFLLCPLFFFVVLIISSSERHFFWCCKKKIRENLLFFFTTKETVKKKGKVNKPSLLLLPPFK